MPKKFDVVIGNPPYQDDLIGDNETKSPPIYDKFMDAAFDVAEQAVLITPARFLSNAGQTPKAWNMKTLSDKHLRVAHFEADSSKIFPGPQIDGGVVVTHRDVSRILGPIGENAHAPSAIKSIADTVRAQTTESLSSIITEHPSSWNRMVFTDHPELSDRIPKSSGARLKTNTFERMAEVCWEDEPVDGHAYVRILGLLHRMRTARWIRADYLVTPPVTNMHKVILAAADGAAVKAGRVIGSPTTVGPNTGFTQTFLAVGMFESSAEANACAAYIKTKFTRALLSILKTTQHNSAMKWKYVPAQDFSANSDIDWTKPIPEIDQQLYAKYGLAAEEIAFIEDNVKPME
ncbi:Eco57I restriction-modification methylase domain-containing protein [Corynebacterium variabile]|uniref:Eco57I restriction-modification methylase domain-containing protein n=1 Tax=Corynebacterium variabile TaxID=1727 RepID=UPI002FDFE1AA